MQGGVGELHDDADFALGAAVSLPDLNVVEFVNLDKVIATATIEGWLSRSMSWISL